MVKCKLSLLAGENIDGWNKEACHCRISKKGNVTISSHRVLEKLFILMSWKNRQYTLTNKFVFVFYGC